MKQTIKVNACFENDDEKQVEKFPYVFSVAERSPFKNEKGEEVSWTKRDHYPSKVALEPGVHEVELLVNAKKSGKLDIRVLRKV